MFNPKIPENLLIHEFDYYEFDEVNRDGEDQYRELVHVNKTRVDMTPVFSRDKEENKITANGVIFCYVNRTTPYLDFKERSKIIWNGNELIVTKVIPIYLMINVPFAYELEVV